MRLIKHVNIKQGTKSVHRFSGGNTLPLTQLPFAMAGFAPQTKSNMGPWFYHPDDRCIEGVRLTHQPSPWIGEYGAIVLMPQTQSPQVNSDKRWSGFRPEEAVLQPDYMKIKFLRSRTVFELTPTERGGKIRIQFNEQEGDRYLSVLPVSGFCSYFFDTTNSILSGYTTCHNADDAKDFRAYFVIKFNQDDCNYEKILVSDHEERTTNGFEISGENTGIHIAFNNNMIEAHMAISYISTDQAIYNMEQDSYIQSFDIIRKNAETIWENYLRRVEVETETDDQLKTFYSCLYRVFLFPHKCYELDKSNRPIHYCPSDGSIQEGYRYTDVGFWDTYRTNFPLLSIVAKDELKEMVEGFVQDYIESGWLPRWPSIGEVGCMPSTLIDAVIADVAVKEILPHSVLENALLGMIHHANEEAHDPRYGRNGVLGYLKYGYVPNNMEEQSVNLTLDAAYGDYCIAEVARILKYHDIEKKYRLRSKNYRNLFDASTGFMRGRNENGKMKDNFCSIEWGGEYTEGSAWQSSFAVQHDLDGLAALYGGTDQLLKKLDDLFETPPNYMVGGYKHEIHEMSEMAAVDFGQCAISNQPSFHIPYIYAVFNQVEKTNYWVKKICNKLFSWKDDGFPGDEDNGSMSAWYIFSCLGIYPICPGKPEYIMSEMLVKSAKINGKSLKHDGCSKWIHHNEL